MHFNKRLIGLHWCCRWGECFGAVLGLSFIIFFSSYSVEVCIIVPYSCLDGTVLVWYHEFCFASRLSHLEHWCMRVNLSNNGQNCSVGKSAGLFKWIVMLCNNLNYEVSLIS